MNSKINSTNFIPIELCWFWWQKLNNYRFRDWNKIKMNSNYKQKKSPIMQWGPRFWLKGKGSIKVKGLPMATCGLIPISLLF